MEKKNEIRIPWGSGIVGYVAQSGEPLNIPDAYKVKKTFFFFYIILFSIIISCCFMRVSFERKRERDIKARKE